MLACDLWYRVDFLHRHGYKITTRPDGTRVAVGPVTFPLPAHCGHVDCPVPHGGRDTTHQREVAA